MEEELICFPSESATHRLILLHGWGADAEDLIFLGKHLMANQEHSIELVSFMYRLKDKSDDPTREDLHTITDYPYILEKILINQQNKPCFVRLSANVACSS